MLSAHELFRLDDISHMGLICIPPLSCSPPSCSLSASTMSPQSNPSQSSWDSIAAKVPAKYHDFLDIFINKEATELPPHQAHDIKIELEQGTNPPFGLIYTLTDKEKEGLQSYLADNLAKGFIHPSTSPATVDGEKLRAMLLINPTKSTLLPILNQGEVGPKTQGRPLVSGSTGN